MLSCSYRVPQPSVPRLSSRIVQAGKWICLALFLLPAIVLDAHAWPSADQWNAIYRDGEPIQDDISDTSGSRNVVADTTHAAAFLSNDGTYMYFRMRLDDDPSGTGGQGLLQSFGWGFEVDVDQDAGDYEWLFMVDGVGTEGIDLWQNTVQGTLGDPSDKSEVLHTTIPLAGNFQVSEADTAFNGDPDYFFDFRFPYSTFKTASGLTDNTPVRFFEGSSSSTNTLSEKGADLVGTSDLYASLSDFSTPYGAQLTTGVVAFVTDLAGNGDVTDIDAGDTVYIRVDDNDQNFDITTIQNLTVTLTTTGGDSETLTLVETGVDTGVFTASLPSTDAAPILGDQTLQLTPGEIVTVAYIDEIDAAQAVNQTRNDRVNVRSPQPVISLEKSVDKATALPGDVLTYTIHYRNAGQGTAHTFVLLDTIPPSTTYLAGSIRIGSAGSTYGSATPKTDTGGDDEAEINGSNIIVALTTISPDDGTPDAGTDEGKAYFKVTVD